MSKSPSTVSGNPVTLGEVVRFHFSTHPPLQGVLKYMPSAPGDCWVIVQDGGTPIHIQQFDYMHPIRESDNDFKF